ncbi:unnamed protein product [Mytilus edulis]|uniref:C2H2-type domain-containing protein n=1 Tax=Mytilus edulis TaxID=6550 RepID=A0A8S3U812_MYTED|nr:unnamed protein product [Mytilus edulis]
MLDPISKLVTKDAALIPYIEIEMLILKLQNSSSVSVKAKKRKLETSKKPKPSGPPKKKTKIQEKAVVEKKQPKTNELKINAMLEHAKNMPFASDKQYKCGDCSKQYVHNKDLVNHINAKHSDTIYKCDTCQLKFSYKKLCFSTARQHTVTKPMCVSCVMPVFDIGRTIEDIKNVHQM